MTYPLFLEQLLLARDQFALEPTVRVNCTESGDFVEVDSISTSHRIIELNVGLKNLDFEERCERALEELAEAQDQIEEMAERIRGKDTEIAELESQVEELEEVNTEVYRDRDDGYSEITKQIHPRHEKTTNENRCCLALDAMPCSAVFRMAIRQSWSP